MASEPAAVRLSASQLFAPQLLKMYASGVLRDLLVAFEQAPSTAAAVQEFERQLVQQEVVSGCGDLAERIIANGLFASAPVAQVLPGLLRIGDERIAEDLFSVFPRGARVYNVLHRADVYTWGELAGGARADLRYLWGVGRRSATFILAAAIRRLLMLLVGSVAHGPPATGQRPDALTAGLAGVTFNPSAPRILVTFTVTIKAPQDRELRRSVALPYPGIPRVGDFVHPFATSNDAVVVQTVVWENDGAVRLDLGHLTHYSVDALCAAGFAVSEDGET